MMSTHNLERSVGEPFFTDAEGGGPAAQPVTFHNNALQHIPIHDLIADEDDPPEEDQHSTPEDYAFSTKTSNLKRDRAKFLLQGYRAVGVNDVPDKELLNLTSYMENNVRVITPEVLDIILESETKSGRLDEFGIVDLRAPCKSFA
ncbi:hypothetical protein FVEG_17426 [Fusarium verticillioides 7600]|uniref:Uncharacterized protein n=1 Tax=Gibberella moniliformis (strain M3125 / FGSC 7600) TaxID=334819 RepID=W7N5M2_GIBM7|nr:hypothetical protein FVEG_17426 [Fusarium verticillioides 7600]EWG54939.1 hypothetical protein FVEG_17426 [Fusarium verticillioides 7600]